MAWPPHVTAPTALMPWCNAIEAYMRLLPSGNKQSLSRMLAIQALEADGPCALRQCKMAIRRIARADMLAWSMLGAAFAQLSGWAVHALGLSAGGTFNSGMAIECRLVLRMCCASNASPHQSLL